MAKTTPWLEIKAQYLQGVTPKELAKKYKLTAKQINDKVSRDKWAQEKAEIRIKTQENVEGKIKQLTNLALEALVSVIKDPECKNADKVSASKALLDISGLKSSKQEITGKDGEPLAIKKVFITPEQVEQMDKMIDEAIN